MSNQEPNDLKNVTYHINDPDEIPGRCSCGNAKFDLKYVNNLLLRTCKECNKAKFI